MRSGIVGGAVECLKQPHTWLTALAGTAAIDAFLRLAPKVGLAAIDYFNINGTLLLSPGLGATLLGAGIMSTGAVMWVILFCLLRSVILGRIPPILAGLVFGWLVYLVSSLVVLPAVGSVHPLVHRGAMRDPGFFGLGLGGWRAPVSNLLGHTVFGLVLGASEVLRAENPPRKRSRREHTLRVESAMGRLGRRCRPGLRGRPVPRYVHPAYIWEKARPPRKRR